MSIERNVARSGGACIAALHRASNRTQVLAHFRAAIDPTSKPGPDVASAVLSIPTTKEH